MKERQVSFFEKVGAIARNGGIVARLIGLLVNSELFALAVLTAAGGEILRRVGKSKSE